MIVSILEHKLGEIYFNSECRTSNGVITYWNESAAGRAKPTEQEIQTWKIEYENHLDANRYKEQRFQAYSPLHEFAEAYLEKEVEGRPEKWDAYVATWQQVRNDFPKPELGNS